MISVREDRNFERAFTVYWILHDNIAVRHITVTDGEILRSGVEKVNKLIMHMVQEVYQEQHQQRINGPF